MFEMWIEIVLFVFLGICAIWDVREKEIPLTVVWIGIAAAAILRISGATGDGTWWAAVSSLFPGVMFWVLSFVTREKVGYGDGWMLIMTGLFVGLWKCFLVLLIGLAAESMMALVLLAVKRITKDREIPFAPFLLLGLGVVVCL